MISATVLQGEPSAAVLAFRRLLEQAEDADGLTALLCTEAQRTLLRRAAIPRMFDRRLVERAMMRDLRQDPAAGATYEWLIAHDDVEAIAAFPGCHRVKEGPRAAANEQQLAALIDDPDAWDAYRKECGHLAQALDRHDANWESEAIYHLAVANPADAATLFAKVYDAADAALDFARCEHLLATLDARSALLDRQLQSDVLPVRVRNGAWELSELLDDRERLFATRRRFAEELRLSAHVLERDFMRDEVTSLDQHAKAWIVNLEAQGGRGKSAFINWFIARHAVPRRIPVAKVDFDNPRWSTGHHAPWEFLLHFAEELNGQLHGGPLTSFIDELTESSRGNTARQAQQGASPDVRLNVALEETLAEDAPARLGAVLEETTTGPVLLVLDTLEELTLRGLASLVAIVDVLAAVHAVCPRVRLYLSGRFNLADRDQAMWTRYEGVVRRITIENFSAGESASYLREIRGIRSAKLVRAVTDRTRGLPFQLSLIADLLQSRPDLTARDVKQLHNLDLHFLVLKVLRRIERPELRWLLRYGVVPKALTKAFVRDVMLPDLKLAMAGASRHDDPQQDPAELRSQGQQFEPVLVTADTPVDVDALWSAITSYASQCSFVNFDGERRDALIFHADVRRPMRRVLQRRAARTSATIFERLHRRALRQAQTEARAALRRNPEQWGAATARALYHAYQLSAEKGAALWTSVLETVDTLDSPEARRVIATELTLPEFVDDQGRPLTRGDGSPLLLHSTLARAHLEKARACRALAQAAAAEGLPEAEWWTRAEAAIAAIDALRRTKEPLRLHVGTLAVLRAEIRGRGVNAPDPATREKARRESRRILERARRTAHLPVQRFEVDVALAQLDVGTDPEAAIDRYRRALARTRSSGDVTGMMRREVLLLMAWPCVHAARYAEGIEAMQEALRLTTPRERKLRLNIMFWLATLQHHAGEDDAAIATVRRAQRVAARSRAPDVPVSAEELAQAHQLILLHAELCLARHEHDAALAAVADGFALFERQQAGERDALQAEGRALVEGQLRAMAARVHLSRHALAATERELAAASDALAQAGDAEEATLLLVTDMSYRIRECGDVRLAESLAGKAGQHRVDEYGSGNVRSRLAAIEVYDRLGRREHADRQMQHLLALSESLSPRRRIPVLVRALVREAGPDRARLLRRLLATLERVTPSTTVLTMLAQAVRPTDRLALTSGQLKTVARAAGLGRRGRASRTNGRSSIAVRVDEIRVALALGQASAANARLQTIAGQARTPRGLAWLHDVQELQLAVADPKFAPERLTRSRQIEKWRTHLTEGLSLGVALVNEGMLHQRSGNAKEARRFGEAAVAALKVPDEPVTRWLALAHELLADVAERDEDRAAAREEARRIYEHHADMAELARFAPQPTKPSSDAISPPSSAASAPAKAGVGTPRVSSPAIVLRLARGTAAESKAGPCVVMTYGSRAPHAPTRNTALGGELWQSIAIELEKPASLGIPIGASRYFGNSWERFGKDLANELLPAIEELAPLRGTQHPVDIEIIAQEPLLEALPWELLIDKERPAERRRASRSLKPSASTFLNGGHGVRLLYRGLRSSDGAIESIRWIQRLLGIIGVRQLHTDGVLGPSTRGAIEQFQRQNGLAVRDIPDPATVRRLVSEVARHSGRTRPRLLYVLGESSASLRRGTRTRSVLPQQVKPSPVLAGPQYDMESLLQPTADQIATTIQSFRPDVILIRGVCRTATNRGGVVIDVSGLDDRAKGADRSVDASSLARMIGRDEMSLRPMVLVDAQLGSGNSERVRALFLRNAFAGELAALGSASAVVALGLHELGELRSSEMILNTLAEGQSIAEAVIRRRRAFMTLPKGLQTGRGQQFDATSLLNELIPTLGVALWSSSPHDVFLPLPESNA